MRKRLYESIVNGLQVVAPAGSCGKALCGPGTELTLGAPAAPGEPQPAIPCGQLQANGESAWPAVYDVQLGSGTGEVTLTFNAVNAPDKFIVEYDGAEVINTGYRGSTSQAALNSRLAFNGAAPEPIAGPGQGTATFTKTTASPATARVYVWAPGAPGTTIWSFTLGCPVGNEV